MQPVYNATMTTYSKTNELFQEAGFTTLLPCLGDHEIGMYMNHEITFYEYVPLHKS